MGQYLLTLPCYSDNNGLPFPSWKGKKRQPDPHHPLGGERPWRNQSPTGTKLLALYNHVLCVARLSHPKVKGTQAMEFRPPLLAERAGRTHKGGIDN